MEKFAFINRVKQKIGFISGPLWYNIAIIFAIIILLIASSFYVISPNIQAADNNIVTTQRHIAFNTSELLNLFLDNTFSDLINSGSHIVAEPDKSNDLAGAVLGGRPDFQNLLVFDINGVLLKFLKRDGTSSFLSGVSIKDTAFFKDALRNGRYISPVFFGKNGPTIQVAAPIERGGKIVAVATSEVDFTLLWKIVINAAVEHGKVYLVDSKGTIIADPATERARSGENLRYRAVVDLLVRGDNEVDLDQYTNESGTEVVALGLSMAATKWGVVVEQNKSAAFAQRNQTVLIAVIFTGASFALIILLIISTFRLMRALLNVERERQERERTIAFVPDGIIEYNGENLVLAINPAANKFLDIAMPLPANLKIAGEDFPPAGLEKLWRVFFPAQKRYVSENTYEITFETPTKRILQIVTVYIKGAGPLSEQRYLKIIHDATKERL